MLGEPPLAHLRCSDPPGLPPVLSSPHGLPPVSPLENQQEVRAGDITVSAVGSSRSSVRVLFLRLQDRFDYGLKQV